MDPNDPARHQRNPSPAVANGSHAFGPVYLSQKRGPVAASGCAWTEVAVGAAAIYGGSDEAVRQLPGLSMYCRNSHARMDPCLTISPPNEGGFKTCRANRDDASVLTDDCAFLHRMARQDNCPYVAKNAHVRITGLFVPPGLMLTDDFRAGSNCWQRALSHPAYRGQVQLVHQFAGWISAPDAEVMPAEG